jgi:hypothetical protein
MNKNKKRRSKENSRRNWRTKFLSIKKFLYPKNTESGWNEWDWQLTSSALMILKYKSLPQPRPYFMDIIEQIQLFPPLICSLLSCNYCQLSIAPSQLNLFSVTKYGSDACSRGVNCLAFAMINYLFLKGLCASTYTCAFSLPICLPVC